MKLYVNRKFSAAHHLPRHVGACRNLHGHTWKVEVWLKGEVNTNGMLVDFGEVKAIIDLFDHSNLNDTFENPTAENLALYFHQKIPFCIKVRVWESENCYAEMAS